MKLVLVIVALTLYTADAVAQNAPRQAPAKSEMQAPPGRSLKASRELKLETSYKDSAEFAKLFEEIYPLVAPETPLNARLEKLFQQQARGFARQGIDSLKAYEAVMKAFEPDFDKQVVFRTFRALLTADELAEYKKFISTPFGKKLTQIGQRLFNVSTTEVDGQVRRVFMQTVAPLRKSITNASVPTTQSRAPNAEETRSGRPASSEDND